VLLGIACAGGFFADNFGNGVLFALLFSGFPPIVSMVLSMCMKKTASQVILAVSSLLYGVFFAYSVYHAFYVQLYPQSGLVFLLGVFMLPYLLAFWIVVFVVDRWRKK